MRASQDRLESHRPNERMNEGSSRIAAMLYHTKQSLGHVAAVGGRSSPAYLPLPIDAGPRETAKEGEQPFLSLCICDANTQKRYTTPPPPPPKAHAHTCASTPVKNSEHFCSSCRSTARGEEERGGEEITEELISHHDRQSGRTRIAARARGRELSLETKVDSRFGQPLVVVKDDEVSTKQAATTWACIGAS